MRISAFSINCLRVVLAIISLGVATASAQDKIVIRGSNTIGEELAPALIAEYQKSHTNVVFDLECKGTAYGVGALMGGYCDIAAASKPVGKEQQEIAQLRGVRFKEYILGAYTVAVLVNAANPVSNLTSNQVQGLFTGKIANWKELGGADAPVHPVVRDPVSGTYLGFKEIAMGYQEYSAHSQFATNYAGIAAAVAADPNAVGYTGLNVVQPPGIKTVAIDGVIPTAGAVNLGKYLYERTLRLYTDANKESTATSGFITFALSPAGQQIVAQLGNAPRP